jgi:arylsulfatase A-like enzyme
LAQRFLKSPQIHSPGRLTDQGNADQLRRDTYQKLAKDILRCGVGIDENVGRILDYLDQHQLADNTIVIYTSDQGYFLGEHNYFDKRFMYEESLRMPFVIRYPPEIKPGTTLGDFVLNVDFAQTLLDFAGGTASEAMQGRSFRSNLAGNSPADWRTDMYYRYHSNEPRRPAHFGLRTANHKLIKYDGIEGPDSPLKWELFDLSSDPQELVNIYDRADPRLIAELKARLHAAQEATGDQE